MRAAIVAASFSAFFLAGGFLASDFAASLSAFFLASLASFCAFFLASAASLSAFFAASAAFLSPSSSPFFQASSRLSSSSSSGVRWLLGDELGALEGAVSSNGMVATSLPSAACYTAATNWQRRRATVTPSSVHAGASSS